MSTKIGNFEILSELAKSATGAVYKANDPQSGQTIALKAIQLSAFGEAAVDLEKSLLEEAEQTKVLSSPNITPMFGAGEIEGQFCAAMEYVQGNSVATMLARKEGFSIWDLLDIGRQVCGGLEHAGSNRVYHYSLEPSKIMCGWDGTVKILGFGMSSVGKFVGHFPGGAPAFLHYLSPEQARGEVLDARSNVFSLSAMFYEMVTDRKAFGGGDVESLRQSILESTPVPPMQVNPKVHPLLNDLIMKGLQKDPSQRYQRGRELLDDLEKCKELKPQAAKTVAVPEKPKVATRPAVPKIPAALKTNAAAAGMGNSPATTSSVPEIDLSNQFMSSGVEASIGDAEQPSASMSSAAPAVERFAQEAPKIAVDPMMAEGGPSRGSGTSFSEISELPPLKEIYVAPEPPPPAPVEAAAPAVTVFKKKEEKPKVQPREVARQAIKEIKGVPPQLMVYSVVGAVVLILVIAAGVLFHIHSLNSEDDANATRSSATAETPVESAKPVPPSQPVTDPVVEAQPAATPTDTEAAADARPASVKGRNARRKGAAPTPVVVPGQMTVDSTPPGAQVQIDGASDPSWVTPVALTGLQPGPHAITVSKAGYSADTRKVDIASGSRGLITMHLAQLMATLSVTSNPAGANIYVDGKDMGKVTPARVNVDKGQHVVLVRKMGYIDVTSSAQFTPGQTVALSPALLPLGNADSMKTVGKMKKLFGGKGAQGQVAVSIRTQPKGAQIAINQRMLEKESPVDVMLDPGNYVIDITLSGYAPIHKVVTADKGNKVVLDEIMQPR
jgi:serine/threonine protein kinase